MEKKEISNIFQFMPEEIRIEDLLLLVYRNNKMVIKEPKKNTHKHLTFQIGEKSFNLHETIEKPKDKDIHLPIVEFSFDWQLVIMYMIREFVKLWEQIFTFTNLENSEWNQMDAELFPPALRDMFIPRAKKVLIDSANIEKFEPKTVKMGKLPMEEVSLGIVNRNGGQLLFIAHKTHAIILNMTLMEKITEKAIKLSVNNITTHRFMPRILLLKLEIRLTKIWQNLTGDSIKDIKDENKTKQVVMDFSKRITDQFSPK